MTEDPKRFWQALQTGIEVAVASSNPQKLLGVRDGFARFCRHRLPQPVSVVVVPQEDGLAGPSLPISDEETANLALGHCRALRERLAGSYLFFVAAEGGLDSLESGEQQLFFTRYWSAVTCDLGEALGSSTGLQLPNRMIEGLASSEIPLAVPGRRRKGGMLGSLTAGVTTQRDAVADATFNALSTLFYGILTSRNVPARSSSEPF
jgi:non-canonical (house-cleaning) NTP pyrophosphatase